MELGKLNCNIGIKKAALFDNEWPQIIKKSDCLLKTQNYANLKKNVYNLTGAPCYCDK